MFDIKFTILVLVIFHLNTTSVKAQVSDNLIESSSNNYEFLLSVTDGLVSKVMHKIGGLDPSKKVLFSHELGDSLSWFIEKRFINILTNAGQEIFEFVPDSIDFNGYEIKIKTIKINVSYAPDIKRDLIWKRKGLVAADIKVVEHKTGLIVLNDVFFENKSDWINRENRKNIEDKSIEFTIGQLEEGMPVVRYKPIIITAITGIIVYLFYALRTR